MSYVYFSCSTGSSRCERTNKEISATHIGQMLFLEKGLKLKTSAESRFSESKSNCKSLPLSFFSWIVGNYDRGGIHKKSRREQKRENEASGRNILKGLEQKKEEEPELNLVPCLFRLD